MDEARNADGAPTICLSPGAADYPQAGGHLWAYLNWALSLRAIGCRVIWLEDVGGLLANRSVDQALRDLETLSAVLERWGLGSALAVTDFRGHAVEPPVAAAGIALEAAAEQSDLLLNFTYEAPGEVVGRFRRAALVDLDPGLLQIGMARGDLAIAPHDAHFSVGETVGTPQALFPDGGVTWHHAPRPVALDAWDPLPPVPAGAYTTVTNWWGEYVVIDGETVDNEKRTAFMPLLDLPGRVAASVELALTPDDYTMSTDGRLFEEHGWIVRDAWEVAGGADAFRDYVRGSRGELSAAKASCGVLANAWISDRTVCYLASGRPAVVEHTGPSRVLPDADGLFRFRDVDEAAAAIQAVEEDYDHHARRARELAEEHFDGERVLRTVLEVALQ